MPPALDTRRITVNDVDFTYLACGDTGPLALCLHGFPDSAHTWRHLLPVLAEAGYRAVAPFQRGTHPPQCLPTVASRRLRSHSARSASTRRSAPVNPA